MSNLSNGFGKVGEPPAFTGALFVVARKWRFARTGFLSSRLGRRVE